jgi:signal transduction histidine kinase
MNFYALSGLFNGIAATALGIFVYLQAPHTTKHRAYGLYCLSLSIWSYFYFAWQVTESRDLAFLFTRLLMVGAIMIPVFYLYHVLTLLDLIERYRSLLRVGYFLSAAFLLSNMTPFFIDDLKPEMSFRYWPKPGILFHFFLAWFAAYVSFATYLIGVAYLRSTGIRRNQYLYLTIGSLVGYVGGATNFPLWYGIQIPPAGTILVSVYVSIVAYAMLRYRLLDFSAAVEKGLTYLLLMVLVVLPTYPILVLLQKAYFGTVSYTFSMVLLLLFTLVMIGAYSMKTEAQAAIARTLFKSRHDMYETLSAFSKVMVTILDLKSLVVEIVHTLVKVIDIKTASIYLFDKEKDFFTLFFSYGLDADKAKEVKLRAGEDLPQYLAHCRSILVCEELAHTSPPEAVQAIVNTLTVIGAEVCIPLINKDRLIGFCNLGSRSNEQMYSENDLSLLTALGQNAAIALDNAMLYEDLKRSQTLVQRTDRLRSLETIAGGFAHEIRNPLTSIKTFVQLAPERKDDSEFIDQFSKIVSEDVDRIERLIREILDYARYMEPRFMEEDLNDVVSSCLYFVEVKAGSKSITIERHLASGLPPVRLDRQQIKQVLLNLFLNAMDAMGDSGGTLTVRTRRLIKQGRDTWVQIEVADTGSGIPADNLEHIFDPFYTTKHESGEREGTGLGLSIVHQIVQEHRGYIEVESMVGNGTTFFVSLPVNPVLGESSMEQQSHEKANFIGR